MQPVALLLSLLLSVHGLHRKSLSPSGAIAAFVVGFGCMSGGLWAFGTTPIGFYLVGSRATKCGKQRKAKLEDGYHEAGYRSGWQVICNSAAGFVATVLWTATFVPDSVQAQVLRGVLSRETVVVYDNAAWCPVDRTIGGGWSRALVFMALGHYACCLGDTLASELGILSPGRPRLITTFKPVPPGTNGGMSLGGTLASVGGGAVVGVIMGGTLLLENAACRGDWSNVVLDLLLYGAFAGFFGSLVDSLTGATLQRTHYAKDRKVILQDGSDVNGTIEVVSGLNILTNNQVNLLSSIVTALLTASR